MIYKSRNKLKEIIEDNHGLFSVTPAFSFGKSIGEGISAEVAIKPELHNSVKKAVLILKRDGLYDGILRGTAKEGHYYELYGLLSYTGLQSGLQRKMADPGFLKRIRERDFFSDDLLLFQIDFRGEQYLHVEINCQAENIQCFGEQAIKEYTLFSPNTSDPGILERQLPVSALIRVEKADPHKNLIQGSPLYIQRICG